MLKYTIKELEKVSGVKAHTIRIWEKRYNLLTPRRTDTNIRYYDNAQLKKLINVGILLENGRKISYIGNLKEEQIQAEIKSIMEVEPTQKSTLHELYVKELLVHTINFDKPGFDKTFDACILKFGLELSIEQILYPLLNQIGQLWLSDEINPAQEHFLSAIAKQKLFAAVDGLRPEGNSGSKFILFLPDNEDHEIGLLYANYLLMKQGISSTYLGPRTPLEHLKTAVGVIQPSHLLFSMTAHVSEEYSLAYFSELSQNFPDQKILVFGNIKLIPMDALAANIMMLPTPASFKDKITKLPII